MTEDEWDTLKAIFAITESSDEVQTRPHLTVIKGGSSED